MCIYFFQEKFVNVQNTKIYNKCNSNQRTRHVFTRKITGIKRVCYVTFNKWFISWISQNCSNKYQCLLRVTRHFKKKCKTDFKQQILSHVLHLIFPKVTNIRNIHHYSEQQLYNVRTLACLASPLHKVFQSALVMQWYRRSWCVIKVDVHSSLTPYTTVTPFSLIYWNSVIYEG